VAVITENNVSLWSSQYVSRLRWYRSLDLWQ